jgi:hypothetical protein
MAETYSRTLVEMTAAMLLSPKATGVLASGPKTQTRTNESRELAPLPIRRHVYNVCRNGLSVYCRWTFGFVSVLSASSFLPFWR